MNIGQLTQRITIQRSNEVEDTHGVSALVWRNFITVWASANAVHGEEKWTTKGYEAQSMVEFGVRYGSVRDLTVVDRIVFRKKIYNIVRIDNVRYKNEVLNIKAVEVKG